MKKFLAVFTAAVVTLLCAAPVLAAGLSISPGIVEFNVPADGSGEVEFLVYDFNGDLEISLENIPLRVEPTTVAVTAKEGGTKVVLTFYGDESLGSEVFTGKIRFLAMTGGTVAMGIKVRATVNQIAAGQPLLEVTSPVPEEASPEEAAVEQAPSEEAPTPLSPSETTELNIPLLAVIAASTVIIITLILVVARRSRQ